MLNLWNRRRSCLPALFALAVLLAMTPAARAWEGEVPDGAEAGWKKVIAYARCGFLVFAANTPIQWTAAILDCTKQYLDEPRVVSGGV